MGTDEETGKLIRKTLGTYATRDEAEAALYAYKQNPYALDSKATFQEVYKTWSERHYPEISDSTAHNYMTAYKRCSFLYKKEFSDITLDDLEYVCDTAGVGYPSLKILKSLLNSLYKYAMPRHLCGDDLSRYLDIDKYKDNNPKTQAREKITIEEINRIWNYKETDIGKISLMLIYSGCRIGELLNLRKEDCHLNERYIDIVDAKTPSGIRKVPIASKTLDFWLYFFNADNESEYLIYTNDRDFHGNTSRDHNYKRFLDSYWTPFMKSINICKSEKPDSAKTPHEARYATASMLQEQNINEAAIKAILGHKSNDVTRDVYTHFSIDFLLECIDKI